MESLYGWVLNLIVKVASCLECGELSCEKQFPLELAHLQNVTDNSFCEVTLAAEVGSLMAFRKLKRIINRKNITKVWFEPTDLSRAMRPFQASSKWKSALAYASRT
ncbi:hypothetical protein CEXT_107231 [Caerostris extrusa]|uniref:Uncharacterized protein n=1 Tax=Caerostris extrusa TaxID=172846 RepID=A0AAV4TCH8_CAEEX|nr:hypothetical protein CEXT_107231 [Caerostris extrusa]